MKCETVKIKEDNEQGFIICNADAVPDGAELFDESDNGSNDDPREGTVAWIKAELDKKETSYDDITLKADLQALLDLANEPND